MPHFSVICNTLPGIGRNHYFFLTVSGQQMTLDANNAPAQGSTSYQLPTVSLLTPIVGLIRTGGGDQIQITGLDFGTRAEGKYSKRRSGTRMEHCSYRYSVFFDMIPLLMSSIDSYLSNKPKQCILKNQIVEI